MATGLCPTRIERYQAILRWQRGQTGFSTDAAGYDNASTMALNQVPLTIQTTAHPAHHCRLAWPNNSQSAPRFGSGTTIGVLTQVN